MTRVWQWNRPVTVREVLEDLQRERSIAYTTVMTVLDNLHQKGWVRREVEGRAYRYTAVSTRAAYSAALMNEAWAQSDNPAAALVAFFGMMSPGQREALDAAVRIVQGGNPEAAAAVPAAVPAPAESAESTESAETTKPAEAAGATELGEVAEPPAEPAESAKPAGATGPAGAGKPAEAAASAETAAATEPAPAAPGESGEPAEGDEEDAESGR